jgi:PDZ domain-containing protein
VPWVVAGVLGLFVLFLYWADNHQLNEYAISPGEATRVAPLITVPPGHAKVAGPILLTDVLVSRVTVLSWIPDKLSGDTQLVPADEILGDTPPQQLVTQGYLEMAQSQSAAKAAGERAVGHLVPEHDAGALVNAVGTGSPADGALQVAQTIVGADGRPVHDSCALIGVLHGLAPGDRLQLRVEQSSVNQHAVIRPGPVVTRTIVLGRSPAGLAPSGCPGITTASRAYLGVSVTTLQDFAYPVPVSIDTTQIGGPSAGLAMTLGLIDKLTTGRLTGGRTVAATGTIDDRGDVGPVGGVPQKTVAVEQAGATVFFVPRAEYHDALSKATPSLHVYPVTSLHQVLTILAGLRRHPVAT